MPHKGGGGRGEWDSFSDDGGGGNGDCDLSNSGGGGGRGDSEDSSVKFGGRTGGGGGPDFFAGGGGGGAGGGGAGVVGGDNFDNDVVELEGREEESLPPLDAVELLLLALLDRFPLGGWSSVKADLLASLLPLSKFKPDCFDTVLFIVNVRAGSGGGLLG